MIRFVMLKLFYEPFGDSIRKHHRASWRRCCPVKWRTNSYLHTNIIRIKMNTDMYEFGWYSLCNGNRTLISVYMILKKLIYQIFWSWMSCNLCMDDLYQIIRQSRLLVLHCVVMYGPLTRYVISPAHAQSAILRPCPDTNICHHGPIYPHRLVHHWWIVASATRHHISKMTETCDHQGNLVDRHTSSAWTPRVSGYVMNYCLPY